MCSLQSGFISHHGDCSLKGHQTSQIGGRCHMRRLEDFYVELGSYEAHVAEGMLSSNTVLIGCMLLYSRTSFVQGSEVGHNLEGCTINGTSKWNGW